MTDNKRFKINAYIQTLRYVDNDAERREIIDIICGLLTEVPDDGFIRNEMKYLRLGEEDTVFLWGKEYANSLGYINEKSYAKAFAEKSVSTLYQHFTDYIKKRGTNDEDIPTLEVFSKKMRRFFLLNSKRRKTIDNKKVTFFINKRQEVNN